MLPQGLADRVQINHLRRLPADCLERGRGQQLFGHLVQRLCAEGDPLPCSAILAEGQGIPVPPEPWGGRSRSGPSHLRQLRGLRPGLDGLEPARGLAFGRPAVEALHGEQLGHCPGRGIGRGDESALGSLAASAAVLGISLLVGGLLAALLAGAFRLLHPTSQDTALVILALIGACAAVTTPLGGSAPLATLLAGIVLKQLHPRPWVWPRQLGTAASMLTVVMFVLVSSMAAQGDWGGAITWAALALVGARLAAKMASLLLTGPASSLSLRQSLWVGVAMFPMSAVALLLISQFVVASPAVGAQAATVALPVILLTELLGAVLVGGALVHAREAEPPSQRRGEPPPDDGAAAP